MSCGKHRRPDTATTFVLVRDERHARHRRAEPDPRRRPVDGFRVADRGRFARLVGDALRALPDELLDHLDGVAVVVRDVPATDTDDHEVPLVELDLSSSRGPRSSGVRQRRGRDRSGVLSVHRRPLEARATSRDDLEDLVRIAVVHELADRFGIDDDRLDELGY